MLVNEDIVRATEKRIADKGIEPSIETASSGEFELNLREIALGPEFEELRAGIVSTPDLHRIRIPGRGPGRRRRPIQEPAEVESRLRHASFAGAVPSKAEFERYIGTNDLVDENYLERALAAAQPVCRLQFKDPETGRRAFATGFMISPHLLLTNWHVFPMASTATGAIAEFNYKLDIQGLAVTPVRFAVRPDTFFSSDKELDYAIVAVGATSIDGATPLASFGYHRLVQETGKLAKGEPITIIQHPEGGYRQVALRENQLVNEPKTEELFLLYRSDTAQGSSGSPAFNDSWQIVALHHSGKARMENGEYVLRNGSRVRSLKGVSESLVDWIANEGLRVSVLCRAFRDGLQRSAMRDELVAAMDGDGDIMARSIMARETVARREDVIDPGAVRAAGGSGLFAGVTNLELQAAQINLAHQIVIQPSPAPDTYALRGERPSIIPARALDDSLSEKLVTPIVDRRYGNRKGYDEDFIGVSVPLPKVTDRRIVSRMENDEHVIPYEHFSIVMNKQRRLALFTASNVDAAARVRNPDPGADYSRKGLTGLGERDQEQWLTDPRIPEDHQLPDVFYNKDRQAFDKGHIVRRDDVAWGRTFAQLLRANGDTFHTTNCSPQVLDFNRSNQGGKWGQLENLILKQATTERYSLLAGPVLDDDDEPFEGVDERGSLSVQIPRRYWKIVLANDAGTLQAFAFILEQDLSDVAFEPEFDVSREWAHRMIPISELQDLLGGLTFDAAIRNADQINAARGEELAVAAEIKRAL